MTNIIEQIKKEINFHATTLEQFSQQELAIRDKIGIALQKLEKSNLFNSRECEYIRQQAHKILLETRNAYRDSLINNLRENYDFWA